MHASEESTPIIHLIESTKIINGRIKAKKKTVKFFLKNLQITRQSQKKKTAKLRTF